MTDAGPGFQEGRVLPKNIDISIILGPNCDRRTPCRVYVEPPQNIRHSEWPPLIWVLACPHADESQYPALHQNAFEVVEVEVAVALTMQDWNVLGYLNRVCCQPYRGAYTQESTPTAALLT